MRLRRVLLIVVAVGAGIFLLNRPDNRALRVRDGSVIRFDAMADEVGSAPVVLFGENHDSPAIHRAQLELIDRLRQKGLPVAIGLEMFSVPSQGELDRWVAGTLDQDAFVRVYYREWNMPWPLYGPILQYARDHRIPLVALSIPHDVSRKVAREGFDALSPEERRDLPRGVTCTIDPSYRSFIDRAFSMHSGNKRMFENFCQVQMLWNKTMASRIAGFLAVHPGSRMVVLTGAGHAVRPAIPAELPKDLASRIIVPERERLGTSGSGSPEADYLLLYRSAWRRLMDRWDREH